MKKLMPLAALIVVAFVSLGGCLNYPARSSSEPAVRVRPQAQYQSVTFRNRTGYNIWYLYVSARSNDRWGSDLLGDDVIMNGKSFTIELMPGEYDVQAEDEDGDTYTFWITVDNDGGTFSITLDDLD